MPFRIETPRLLLVTRQPEHAAALVAYRADIPPDRYSPAPADDAFDVNATRARIEAGLAEEDAGRHHRFVITLRDDATGTIVGLVNLNEIVRGVAQMCYIGYELAASARGNGYMTEAVTALCDFAFTTLQLHRVMLNYQPENTASAAVAERCGFIREGFARAYLFLGGEWRDHILTSLTNPTPMVP